MIFRNLNLAFIILFNSLLISTVTFAETCPIDDPTAKPGEYNFNGSPPEGWALGPNSTYKDGLYPFWNAERLSKTAIACNYKAGHHRSTIVHLTLIKFNVQPDSHWNRGSSGTKCVSDAWSSYVVSASDCTFESISGGKAAS